MTLGKFGRDTLDFEQHEVARALAEVRDASASLLTLCAEDKGSLGDRFAALALRRISQVLKDQTTTGRLFVPCSPSACLPRPLRDFRPVSTASGLPGARAPVGLRSRGPSEREQRDLALHGLLARIRQIARRQKRQRRQSKTRRVFHQGQPPCPQPKKPTCGFNIFNILRIEHKEVTTHSRLLASLLDPNGSHGQGILFLNAFLRLLQRRQASAGVFWPRPREWHAHLAGWRVHEEYHTAFGRLDLLLENEALQAAIVVENKLNASDQPGQLQRYWSWLEAERGHWPYVVLVYLSPGGQPPGPLALDAGGTTQQQQQQLIESLICLSYRRDISLWLQGCWRPGYSGELACTLRQYQGILDHL